MEAELLPDVSEDIPDDRFLGLWVVFQRIQKQPKQFGGVGVFLAHASHSAATGQWSTLRRSSHWMVAFAYLIFVMVPQRVVQSTRVTRFRLEFMPRIALAAPWG
jgi:hypothetical protein